MNKGGKTLSISDQFRSFRLKYPGFKSIISRNTIMTTGTLRPTPRSTIYSFKLVYTIKGGPKFYVINPTLVRNEKNEEIPHMYQQERLCLYFPKYSEFTSKMFLSDTIIPWASLWLYYYETWHQTGKWLGGGIHPGETKKRN